MPGLCEGAVHESAQPENVSMIKEQQWVKPEKETGCTQRRLQFITGCNRKICKMHSGGAKYLKPATGAR